MAPIFLTTILVGVFVGLVMFIRGKENGQPADANINARIDSSNIPIRGGIGAGILIAILLTGALIELPALRWLAWPGILGGLLFGGLLVLWRRSNA